MATLSWVTPVAIGLCWFGQTLSLRSRFGAVKIITPGLVVLISLILTTWEQCRTWRDSTTLWTHALRHGASSSATVHGSLGLYFDRQANLTAAAAQYAEALRLDATDVQVHNNLGVVLSRQGKFAEAVAQYTAALRLNPRFASAHYNLALLFVRLGKYAEAQAHLLTTLQIDPNAVDAHYNLGMILSPRVNMLMRPSSTESLCGSGRTLLALTTIWEPTLPDRVSSPRRRLVTWTHSASILAGQTRTLTWELPSRVRASSPRLRLTIPRHCGSTLVITRRGRISIIIARDRDPFLELEFRRSAWRKTRARHQIPAFLNFNDLIGANSGPFLLASGGPAHLERLHG